MKTVLLPHTIAAPVSPRRRQALRQLATLSLAPAALTLTPARAARPPTTGLRILQFFDNTLSQQDVSRDYTLGFRLAWADTPRPVVALDTIGIDTSSVANERLRALRDDPSVLALAGTVGEQLALDCISGCQSNSIALAHMAPWMADTRHDAASHVLPLFASRDDQVRHVFAQLRQVGHTAFGVVYPSRTVHARLDPQLQKLAASLGMALRSLSPDTPLDMAGLVSRLGPDTPMQLLVLCNTTELANLKRALDERQMVRSLICLADTNLAVLKQLNVLGGRSSIVVTQVVDDPTHAMAPATRRYRALLSRLYDEAPNPMSFAGFLAGRYTAELLNRIDTPLSRANVLDAVRRRPPINLGGIAVDYRAQPRGIGLVTQTLLSSSGKLRS